MNQAEAIALLETYIQEDDVVASAERRMRYTGLDMDTVLTWAKVFGESQTKAVNNPAATMFLVGFDVALRVAEDRGLIGEVRPGAPILLDGNHRGGTSS